MSSINIFDWLTPGYNRLINSQSTLQNMAVDTGLILDWHLVQQSVESQLLVSFDWSICLMTIQPTFDWVSVKMPRYWLWVNWVYQSTLDRGCLKYMWSMNWSLWIMDKSQTMEKPVCAKLKWSYCDCYSGLWGSFWKLSEMSGNREEPADSHAVPWIITLPQGEGEGK